MTSILGLDISSFALHGCLLVDDQPPILRMERLGTTKDPLIERVRQIPEALKEFTYHLSCDFDWIVIESAFGHGAHALHLTTGAIISSCPSESQVALISSGDWRKALGAKNTKQAGHEAVWSEFCAWPRPESWFTSDWPHDEEAGHFLDAIGIALAWRSILAGQVAA